MEWPAHCIEWQGATNSSGYGHFCVSTDGQKQWVYAHRHAYETHVGPIPPGMYVCHTCDNKICINPSHLFLGTQIDNMQDHAAKGRHHYGKRTHCKNGHEYTPENTKLIKNGWRICRACIDLNNKRASERRRA